jgi:hypothetical protein
MGLPTDDHLSRTGCAEGTESGDSVGASFVGVSLHGALSLRRGVILWHPVFASGRHCMAPR